MAELLINKILDLIHSSRYSPILAGAIDHWLHNSMTQGKSFIRDFLVVLFNKLAKNESWLVKTYIGSFFYSMIEKNIIESGELFENLFVVSNYEFKKCIVDFTLQLWPNFSPEWLRTLIETCDDNKDNEILGSLADLFADLFAFEPQNVVDFLDNALYGVDGNAMSVLIRGIFDKKNLNRHINFISMFVLPAVLTSFSYYEKMSILRDFLKSKFKFTIDVALSENLKPYSIEGVLQSIIYHNIETSGIYQWNRTIGSHGGNNTFFVEDDALVQRDILYEYYKYPIALHNEDTTILSLEKDGDFMMLTMKMINYRAASIIGYVATLTLAMAIDKNREMLDDIIGELIALDSYSSRYFTNQLLISLSFMDKSLCSKTLDIFYRKLLPLIVEKDNYSGFNSFLIIVSIDVDLYWGQSEGIIEYIYRSLANERDKDSISYIEYSLIYSCFISEIKIGVNVVNYMLEKDLLNSELWRKCTLKVLAAMLSRNPKVLNEILIRTGIDISVLTEIRPYINENMLKMKNEIIYRYAWNDFIVSGFSSAKIRYFLIKCLLGGLVNSNSVEEYSKEFRRFVIEAAKCFLIENKDDAFYFRLSLEDALRETEHTMISGGGEIWSQGYKGS